MRRGPQKPTQSRSSAASDVYKRQRRDYTTIVDGRNPIVAHEFLGSSVEGKDVIILDDMISSGDSILDVARQLKMRKAKRIYACLLYTSDAADDLFCVDLGGRRIIKKKK